MTIDAITSMDGVTLIVGPESLPESAVVRLRALADEYPDAESVSGGLAELLDVVDWLRRGLRPTPEAIRQVYGLASGQGSESGLTR